MQTLFKPDEGQNIFVQYPELKDYPELECLKPKEMRFVWEYCNLGKENPALKASEKAHNAYIAVYGETNDKVHNDFVSGNFSFEIKDAIKVMERFSIAHRLRAKTLAETMFRKIEEAVNSGELDPAKYKQCSELLPSLLKQIEQGFGIRELEEKKDDKKEPTFGDNLIGMLDE